MHCALCTLWFVPFGAFCFAQIILTILTADSELHIIIWMHRSDKLVISQQLHSTSDDIVCPITCWYNWWNNTNQPDRFQFNSSFFARNSNKYSIHIKSPCLIPWMLTLCFLSTKADYSWNGVRSILNGFFPLVTRFTWWEKKAEKHKVNLLRFGLNILKDIKLTSIAINSSNSSSKLRNG